MFRQITLFVLAGSALAGVVHAENSGNATDDPKKVVCKRETVTGSLAQAVRVCHTREEWQLLGEQNREEGRRLQDQSYRQGTHG